MEETIFEIHPSIVVVKTIYIISLIAFLAAAFTYVFPINIDLPLPPVYLPIILAVIGFGMGMVAFMGQISINFTTFTLTTDYFKVKTGFIAQTETMIPLAKIQSVSSSFTPIQSIMNTGDIIIHSADESAQGDIMLLNIDNPEKRKEQIMSAIDLIDDHSAVVHD